MKTVAYPRFGSDIYSDHGQSGQGGGSAKICLSLNGRIIDSVQIKDVAPAGVTDSDDYVQQIANHMAALWRKNKESGRLPEGDQLESITVTTAGAPNSQGMIPIIGKIFRRGSQEPLTKINMAALSEKLPRLGVTVDENLRRNVRILNDMAGGAARAFALLQHSFATDERRTYVMSGGGLGVARLHADTRHRETIIELTEKGHSHGPGFEKEPLETGGASAPALVDNFLSRLSLDPAQRDKLSAGRRAEMVTSFENARRFIPEITETDYRKAADFAVKRFVDALAALAEESLLRGENGMILARTAVAKGVMAYIERYQNEKPYRQQIQRFHQNTALTGLARSPFEMLLFNRLWQLLDTAGKLQLQTNGYSLTAVDIADNTDGAPYLRHSQATNLQNNRLAIPLDAFQHTC